MDFMEGIDAQQEQKEVNAFDQLDLRLKGIADS